MKYEIDGNPDFGQLTVTLERGETFLAESGAMAWMSAGMEVKSRLLGGVGKALIRKIAGGESFFVAEYQHPAGGSVTLSPALPGAIQQRTLNNGSLILTAGSFLACTPGMELNTRFLGFKSFLSGEGGFFLECKGTGEVFFNSYGAIVEKEVKGRFIADTGHVVAFDSTLDFNIKGMGNLKSTFLSGEGLVLEFAGSGALLLQTRTLPALASWLTPYCRFGR